MLGIEIATKVQLSRRPLKTWYSVSSGLGDFITKYFNPLDATIVDSSNQVVIPSTLFLLISEIHKRII